MRYFYTLLFYIALPFFLCRLLWRSRYNADYRKRWLERFGFVPFQLEQAIWVHAVSVGETIAATPLIRALKNRYPERPIVVTTMSVTGSARVHAAFGETVYHTYVPYDIPGAVARFLKKINPAMLIVMETELWPNLFAACQQRQIPVIVTNARLSAKSTRGYLRIRSLTKSLLTAVQMIAAQTQADADRFVCLGMPKERIKVTGSLKFDLELPTNSQEQSRILRKQLGSERCVWIAASTHPGEEEIILAAHRLILKKQPNALLILVPRHPERFSSVAALIQQQNFHCIRRSQALECDNAVEVYLGDSMGELLLLYGVADVAFVGGSLVPVGGHNMLEPGALAKPVITGPQLFNFFEISKMFLLAEAMTMITNAEELAETVLHLFQDKKYREAMGRKAQDVVNKNKGALQRQLQLIHAELNNKADMKFAGIS